MREFMPELYVGDHLVDKWAELDPEYVRPVIEVPVVQIERRKRRRGRRGGTKHRFYPREAY